MAQVRISPQKGTNWDNGEKSPVLSRPMEFPDPAAAVTFLNTIARVTSRPREYVLHDVVGGTVVAKVPMPVNGRPGRVSYHRVYTS